jgi:hypothetical protein
MFSSNDALLLLCWCHSAFKTRIKWSLIGMNSLLSPTSEVNTISRD